MNVIINLSYDIIPIATYSNSADIQYLYKGK